MFTKSGKKLVRITIPQNPQNPQKKNDLPLLNVNTKESNNVVNGHINSILDELVSRGCTVTPLMPEPTAKKEKTKIPPNTRKKPVETTVKEVSVPQISPANNYCISNDVPRLKQKPKLNVHPRKTISSVNSETNDQIQINQPIEQGKNVFDISEIPHFIVVFTAFKAKDILTVPSSNHPPPEPIFKEVPKEGEFSTNELTLEENNTKASSINSKQTNRTEYVFFTPGTNVVQRERAVQVSDMKKESLETAVQCNLTEDENSSESSEESDWINEIIEEYEFIEDNNMYECQICGEVCSSRSSNLKHSMVHYESSLLCFRCGRLFSNSAKLHAHEDKTHGPDKITFKKALRCPKLNCFKAFHSKRQLFDHIEQHSSRVFTEQRCIKCQRSFPTPLQLLCHVNRRNCWR